MNKILYLIFFAFLLSCSSDVSETLTDDIIVIPDPDPDPDPDPIEHVVEFISISPNKVRIGDTITINGTNLNRITQLIINDRNLSLLEQQDDKLKAIIPILNNEKLKIRSIADTVVADSISLDLIGTFPLRVNLDYDVNHIKMINANDAFAAANKNLYKTTDGGYNWELIKTFEHSISSIFFIDENNGWVGLYEMTNFLYSTNDGGTTFVPILETGPSYQGKSVTDIIFSSPTSGYLLTGKGEIYHTNDNSNFSLTYDHPFSDEGSGNIEFNHLSVKNNTLLTIGLSGSTGEDPTLIIGQNNNFEYSILDLFLHNVQLINESQAYLVKGNGPESRLHYLENITQNLTLTSNKKIHDFYFTDINKGIGISSNEGYNFHTVLETYDGGQSWTHEFEFLDFQYIKDIDFYENVGLISGYRGHIWKHIFE